MIFTKFTEKPVEICGLGVVDPVRDLYQRMDCETAKKISEGTYLRSWTAGGGRIRFRTDSKTLTVRAELYENYPDSCIPLPGSAGFDVILGSGFDSTYLGVVAPDNYEELSFEYTFELPGSAEKNVTIGMPRNMRVKNVMLGIDDGAKLFAPVPYKYDGKIVFYGSSVTEGGCVSRPGLAYPAIVSRMLDMDYVNLGMSGAAKGELGMADYINSQGFRIIMMDYDGNAPNAEYLRATHEPFYRRLREGDPDVPIIMMSRSNFDKNIPESIERREVIKDTYAKARTEGDKNVYFIDGEMNFGETGREYCRVDIDHPNDLGHMRMAEHVYPFIKRLLDKGIK